MDAWRVQQSCPASRRDTLISHLFTDRQPAPGSLSSSGCVPFCSDQPNWGRPGSYRSCRGTQALHVGLDPSRLGSHLNDPWHLVLRPEGSSFITNNSLTERFYAPTHYHCAVLLNKDTFARDFCMHTYPGPLLAEVPFVGCRRNGSCWQVRRAPDQSCFHFTVANVHMNNACAKRRSMCTALLLLIRLLCMKLGAVILAVEFKKAVERETPSGDGERRTSPMQAATRTFRGLRVALLH